LYHQDVRLEGTRQTLGTLLTIAYFGVSVNFRKKPEGPWQEYYARQIFRDLIREAREDPSKPKKLALYVHPDNAGAIRLYEDPEFGFRREGLFLGDICMVKDL
jgi:ribosomal protein S18 acetylase RimI-like enzyme